MEKKLNIEFFAKTLIFFLTFFWNYVPNDYIEKYCWNFFFENFKKFHFLQSWFFFQKLRRKFFFCFFLHFFALLVTRKKRFSFLAQIEIFDFQNFEVLYLEFHFLEFSRKKWRRVIWFSATPASKTPNYYVSVKWGYSTKKNAHVFFVKKRYFFTSKNRLSMERT